MFIFRKKFRQLFYGYEDPFEISSHEHILPWKKCTKTLQLKYENFYNSNIVCNSTNDFFHLKEKIVYNFPTGLRAKSSS